jgi:hypothetical protein
VRRLLSVAARGVVAGILAAATAGIGPAVACAYHGRANFGAFSAQPDAVAVALSIYKARRTGVLAQPQRGEPKLLFVGYHRLARNIANLDRCMKHAYENGGARVDLFRFSMFIVEPGLWVQLNFDGAQPSLTLHTVGPHAGEPIVFLAESVLEPLLLGTIAADTAVKSGLVRVTRDSEGWITRLFEQCFDADDVMSNG